MFYPIEESQELTDFKKELLGGKDYDFVLLFNSRNIRRKSIPDTILSFKHFIDGLSKEKADKCCLVLHTHKVDENGTDLPAVIEALLGDRGSQVIFSSNTMDTRGMNLLYNCADAVILLSSNEGWGLSLTEGMMTGKMIIANVTGGMQDQMRFEDENGKWMSFNEKFCSNHLGKYKKCGEWAIPVFPASVSIQGSIPTPYISDDRVDFRDAAHVIGTVYDFGKEERNRRGMLGREWVLSEESMMSAETMCNNIIEGLDEVVSDWTPRSKYNLLKATERPLQTIKFPMSL